MKRRAILKLDDITLDQKVKIQGTQFDRKRKLTDKDINKMRKLIGKGYTLDNLSLIYNVDVRTIKYNLDPDYKAHIQSYQAENYGKHTGIDTYNFENRVAYKRLLIKKRKIKARIIV